MGLPKGPPHVFLDLGGDRTRIHDAAIRKGLEITWIRLQAIPGATTLEPQVLVMGGLADHPQTALVEEELADPVLVTQTQNQLGPGEDDLLEVVLVLDSQKVGCLYISRRFFYFWFREQFANSGETFSLLCGHLLRKVVLLHVLEEGALLGYHLESLGGVLLIGRGVADRRWGLSR